MEDILPDHRDRKPGRTIYDIVADLKKQRKAPPVQDKIKEKKLLPHQIFKIKLEEAKRKLPKSQLKWKRIEESDSEDSQNDSDNESDLASENDSDNEPANEPDYSNEPENKTDESSIDNEDFDEWNYYWNLYKETDMDTEYEVPAEDVQSSKEQQFYDNFIPKSSDLWESLKEEEEAIEKFLLNN